MASMISFVIMVKQQQQEISLLCSLYWSLFGDMKTGQKLAIVDNMNYKA